MRRIDTQVLAAGVDSFKIHVKYTTRRLLFLKILALDVDKRWGYFIILLF